jgi:hypothetical protein
MIDKSNSFILFYPQNQSFVIGESRLPERLMIVDGAYRAFQMPLLFTIGIILFPFILAQGLILLAKVVSIWNLPQVAMWIEFAGFGMIGLALLNFLSIYSNPVLFKWIETIWAKHRAVKIIQNGGEVIDGWVSNVREDSDKDWLIEFKISQEATTKIYSITMPYLPNHLSNLESGSILKLLRKNNYLYML